MYFAVYKTNKHYRFSCAKMYDLLRSIWLYSCINSILCGCDLSRRSLIVVMEHNCKGLGWSRDGTGTQSPILYMWAVVVLQLSLLSHPVQQHNIRPSSLFSGTPIVVISLLKQLCPLSVLHNGLHSMVISINPDSQILQNSLRHTARTSMINTTHGAAMLKKLSACILPNL